MATYVEKAFDALGDATRLAIFGKIARREQSVGEIADGLPVSRPAVSQHLRVLRQARLVDVEQTGARRVYRVRPEGIEALRRYFDEVWARNLSTLKKTAEKRAADGDRTGKKVHRN